MPYCIFIYTHLPTSDDLHRDVIWLALFVVHLIGMGITAGVYGKALVDHIDKNTGDSSVDLDVWKVGKCEGSLFDRDACRKKIHVHTHVHARPCLLHLWPYLSLSLSLSHIDIRKHNAHTQHTHATYTRNAHTRVLASGDRNHVRCGSDGWRDGLLVAEGDAALQR